MGTRVVKGKKWGVYTLGAWPTTYVTSIMCMSASDIDLLVYVTSIMRLILVWYFGEPRHALVRAYWCIPYTGMKPYWCTMAYLTRNYAKFSSWKCGIFLPYSYSKSLMRIVLYVPWRIWPKMLYDFHQENKVKCCWIFIVEFGNSSNVLAKHLQRLHSFPKSNQKVQFL